MKRSRHLGYFRAVFILLTGLGVAQLQAAVTLGPIQVNSYIDEPLDASIALRGISDAQAASTRITLGDAAAYQARGITRTASQSALHFTMVKAGNGYRILVTTNVQVREPFINFILSIRYGGSTINREYALFLNPDPVARAQIAPRVGNDFAASDTRKLLTVTGNLPSPPNIAAESAMSRQKQSPDSRGKQENETRKTDHTLRYDPQHPKASSQQQPNAKQRVSSDSNGVRYWKVESGDTLYSIAAATLPVWDFAIDSWMRSLYLANRQAFISNSMDKLILGSQLRIPAANSIERTTSRSDSETQKRKTLAKKSRQNSSKTGASDKMKEKRAMRKNIARKEADKAPKIDPNRARARNDSALPVEDLPVEEKADSGKKPAVQGSGEYAKTEEKHEPGAEIHETMTDSTPSTKQKTATAVDTPSRVASDDLTAKTPLTKTTQTARTDHSQPPAVDAGLRKEPLLTLDSPQSIADLSEHVAAPAKNDAKAQKRTPGIADTEVRKTISDTVAEQQIGSDVNNQTRGEKTSSGTLSTIQSTAKKAANWVTGKTASIAAALPTEVAAATQKASEKGPMGLPWWQISAAGFGIVLLLLVALRRSRRKAANADMSKEELDRMVADMENDDLFADSIQLSEQERTTLDQVMVENPSDETIAPDDSETESDETPDFENQLLKDSDETGSQNDSHLADETIDDDSISTGGIFDRDDTERSAQVSEADLSDEGWDLQVAEDKTMEDDFSIELDGFSLETDSDTRNSADSIELDNDSDALEVPDFTNPDNDSDALDLSDATEFDDATLFESAESFEQLSAFEEDAVAADDDNALQLSDEDADDEKNTFFADVSAAASNSFHGASAETEASVVQTEDALGSGTDNSVPIDFSDEMIATASESEFSEEISNADEQAMEINLDLAETYIESGVKPEKAKHWLNEVLESGSQEQRDRARILLKKL